LQSVLADLERDEREVFGAIARAERALTRADQELRELPVTRKLEIEKEINELLQQIASYESMISASRDVVGRIAGAQQQAEQEQIRFTIMRKTGQNERFFAAKETTSLHAGDVVIVAVQENRASSMFRGDQTSKEGIDIETTGVLAKGQTGRIPSQEISPR
jgi:hypothetical protein